MNHGIRGLRRIPERGVIAGVCAGFAEYFDWNVRLLRAIVVIVLLCTGPLILFAYGIAWYVMEPLHADDIRSPSRSEPGAAGGAATMADVRGRFMALDQRLQSIEACVTDKEFELRRELRKLES